SEYIRLMQRFYATATRILIKSNAYIDKLIGDEVMAIYLPAMSGTHGARDAVFAARELLIATGHVGEPWIPIGIGVHTGPAFVGSVGSESGIYDMTAVGDTVNIAARFAFCRRTGRDRHEHCDVCSLEHRLDNGKETLAIERDRI